MSALKIIVWITVLSISVVKSDGPETKVLYRKIPPSEEYPVTFIDGIGIENVTLWFVKCKKPHLFGMDCNLSFYNDSTFGLNEESIECTFRLNLLRTEYKPVLYLRALRLNPEIFLVMWIEYELYQSFQNQSTPMEDTNVIKFIKFVTIRVPDCSVSNQFQTSPIPIKIQDYVRFVATLSIYFQNDSFSVIYYSSDISFLLESFDNNGNRMAVRGPFQESDFSIINGSISMATYSVSNKDYIRSQERFKISEKFCRSFHSCHGLIHATSNEIWTTSNGNLTRCKNLEGLPKILECAYLDGENISKFYLAFKYEPQSLMIYNMPNGDLLTVTIKYIVDGKSGDTIHVIRLKNFRDNGGNYNSIEFMRLNWQPVVMMGHLFQRSVEEICLALFWMNKKDWYHKIKCYNNESLGKTR
ncbi:hypothetical protein QAD02_012046 [Eretmocerus hayati]|uniref:Uncharacterized protein n=1 Tax=Eretmocerus hayati TaxID=131215 RepID=A0ACC2P3A3_9HYME|nr:hypothetical protein QAD02_012046 [Eretmocerus hayati]